MDLVCIDEALPSGRPRSVLDEPRFGLEKQARFAAAARPLALRLSQAFRNLLECELAEAVREARQLQTIDPLLGRQLAESIRKLRSLFEAQILEGTNGVGGVAIEQWLNSLLTESEAIDTAQ